MGRRRILGLLLACLALPAQAQEAWPTRSLRLIVPSAPGGGADSSARLLGERLAPVLGQSVVVENRSGGGGTIGGAAVAQARDGHTILLDSTISHLVNPLLIRGMPYDPHTALVPVTPVTRVAIVLAAKRDLPAGDAAAFLALARARPGALSCGTARSGTASHLVGALLRLRAGLEITDIQYRGGADVARDLLGQTLDCGYIAMPNVLPLVQGDRVRMLAIASDRRSALLPGVPTLAEAGVAEAVLDETYGLFAPAGTPPAVLERLAAAVARALAEPEARAAFTALGAEPTTASPGDFATSLARDRTTIERLVREARIELQ